MIDYSESWLILTLLKWKGSVFPRSCLFALPAALITVVLVQAQDVLEFDLRQELGLMDAHRSQLWIISLGVLHALLVFRINRAMERFWEGTGLLHQMRGEWFDAVSCCVTFSRASMVSRPQDTMRFRHAIVRLMSLCHGSALEEIGGEDGDFCETIDSHGLATRTLEHLTDCAEEYDFNRVEVLLHMIQSLITHNLDVGVLKVQPPILSRVYQTLSRGFVNLLNAKKIADTRFPFPFAQLISALLFLHIVLLPVLISAVISQAWLAFTFTFLPIFSMCCLNYIGVELENPFGRDDNDLPLKHFQDPLWAPCNHKFCRHCIIQVLKSRAPEWAGDCPLCRIHISVYNLRDEHDELLVQPDVLELWGCIFVQNGQTGLASYHFDSPDQCYISYEQAPAHWRLDDGSKPPSKKYWTDVSFDAKNSTFRGIISWDTPFDGETKWVYRIQFSEDFAGIIGGDLVATSVDGSTKATPFRAPWIYEWDHHLSYLRWTPPPSTIFGSVYVQGVVYAGHHEGVASYHFESLDNCYISYANAPDSWVLDDGSLPPRRKPFEQVSYEEDTRTFRGVVTWPQGFDGASRWEYTIVFSQDFSFISSGKVQPYGRRGFAMRAQHFGDPTAGLMLVPVLYYTRKPSVLAANEMLRATLLVEDDVQEEEAHRTETERQIAQAPYLLSLLFTEQAKDEKTPRGKTCSLTASWLNSSQRESRLAEMNNCLLMLLHYSADLMAGVSKQRCLMDIMEIRKAMHGTLSESWLQEIIDKAPGSPAEANVKDVEEEESQPNSVQEAGVEVVLPLATQGETSSDGGAAPIFEEPAFEEKLQPTTLLQGMDQAVMALTGIRQAIAMQATDVDRSIDGFLVLAKKLRTQTDDLIADEAEPADVEFTFGWDCSAIPSFEASS
ncbi:unnamed protein product [Symbiodinium necroappetens]|uniref:RING-type domain-containing protein n=1 Tax=Symbiodinium necroappetens TaxID=1628268 RepID=A0A813BLR9_9DINO|nr:unnamed protein product [Symbiodinium necroappetens]